MRNRHFLSLAVGTALAMGARSADAIVIDGAEIGPVAGSFIWTSNTDNYQKYAQGCGVAGQGCGFGTTATISANTDTLFFWGLDGASTNSQTTWTYDATALKYAQPLNLQYVALTATGQAGTQGTQYTPDGASVVGPRLLGTGLTGTWPVDDGSGNFQGKYAAFATYIDNARITILANGAPSGVTGAQIETSRPLAPPSGAPNVQYFQEDPNLAQSQPAGATTPWVMRAGGQVDGGNPNLVSWVQMPVSQAFPIEGAAGIELKNGGTVNLVLNEAAVSNDYGTGVGPSAMLPETTVQLVGTYVASVLGVNNPASVNILSRIGQTVDTATSDATATNTKVSTTKATVLYNVAFGEATTGTTGLGAFSRTGPAVGGNLAEGGSASSGYTYRATDFGTNTGTATIGAITGVNADGTAYTGDTANTTKNVTFQATGVGPKFQTQAGADPVDTAIDFGKVLITKTDLNPSVTRSVTITNTYTGAGDTNLSLTGLTVNSTSKDGVNPLNFSGSPGNTSIQANNGTQTFNLTFAADSAGTKTATMHFNTDLGSATGLTGAGQTFDRTLQGQAFKATLSADSTAVQLGYARIGGAASTPAQAVSVSNQTGGGYDLHAVTFGPATSSTPNATFSGGANVGTLANGATGGTNYSMTAAAAMAPSTSKQTVTGTLAVSSTEAPDVTRTLTGDAVGPVFNFSGNNVNFQDGGQSCNITGPSGNQVCGTVNLGTLDPSHTTTALTIANLFNAISLSGLGDLADLTLINVGFGPSYSQSAPVGTGLFSLTSILKGTRLDPIGGGSNAVTAGLRFDSTAPGTGFVTTLYLLTDASTTLGAESGGTQFAFDITAAWSDAPAPSTLALLALGLAAVRLGRCQAASSSGGRRWRRA